MAMGMDGMNIMVQMDMMQMPVLRHIEFGENDENGFKDDFVTVDRLQLFQRHHTNDREC